MNKKSIALISTMGGHFEELINLDDFYNCYKHFWITNRNMQTEEALSDEHKYFIPMGHFKKPWSYLPHFLTCYRIFLKEKPTHILSTGSGRTCFVPFLLSRLMRIKFIYIDTFARVKGYSKFGSFLHMSHYPFFTQWQNNVRKNVYYIGPIFKKEKTNIKKKELTNSYIFVTVGTREEPFTRLISGVESLKKKGIIKENIIVQAGYTKYTSDKMKIFDFCSPKDIDNLVRNAILVITQESSGIGTKCLKYNTRFIVMPRNYKYGELPAKSDMKEDLHIELEKQGYTIVVNNTEELEDAIRNIDRIKNDFRFDNRYAISVLKRSLNNKSFRIFK
jgi:UDP-N-acetylglucosamine transferase subunit ALG13